MSIPPRPPSSSSPPPPSGLCIVNNSRRPVRPLRKVLEIYSSSKTYSGARDIGENGVGLKQGCATLSDLSFVLVNNSEGKYVELGIIAESLQMAEGCYLPAFRFAISKNDCDDAIESLMGQMKNLFSRTEHANVAKCIERYGSDIAVSPGVGGLPRRWDDGDLLGRGIDRLCRHIDGILNFFDNRYVFAVILDRVSYGKTNDQSRQALDAIRDLRSVIPRTYLHVPAGFDFRIGSSSMNRERTVFNYWPQRLVELSSFSVNVNENICWWQRDVMYQEGLGYDATSYKLRVFVGFDRVRINSPEEAKSASLYVYSRHSGRLIKHEQDARHILGLNAGGTMYCSGLTVLVDDVDGKLPLNPTKQDVAFAEQANGDVHKGNLFAWVGAVTSFFYHYHLAKFNDKKAVLTEKIRGYGSEPTRARMKDIDQSEFTTFIYHHKFYRNKYIRLERTTAKEVIGIDTHFKLVCDMHPVNVPSSAAVDEQASKKRKADHLLSGSDDDAESPTMNQNLRKSLDFKFSELIVPILTQLREMRVSPCLHNLSSTLQPWLVIQANKEYVERTGDSSLNGQFNVLHELVNARTLLSVHGVRMARSILAEAAGKTFMNNISRRPEFVSLMRDLETASEGEVRQDGTRIGAATESDGHVKSRQYSPHFAGQHAIPVLESWAGNNTAASVAVVSGAYHNEGGAPLHENGGHMNYSTAGMMNNRPDRQQQHHLRNEAAPPLVGQSTIADEPTPIHATKTLELDAAITNSNVDDAVGRKGRDSANATMEDTADDDDDDDSVSSTKSYYKNLCEKLTVELEKRNVADHAAKKESKRLKRDVAELKEEVKRQQDLAKSMLEAFRR
ncbi:hypothetical protein ACHAXA_009645 [Cyclostephanos tholiformis]|uniref:Uncharacterized protein n=1 Tax=Cyclostephanos tholiformis TaxID=382380 RepID=A0ABD3SDZ6_9STRA